jgi:hypothetical protein
LVTDLLPSRLAVSPTRKRIMVRFSLPRW